MGKNLLSVESSEEKGVAPVIGTVVTIAIVFILTGLVSSVVFEGYAESFNKGKPVAKLQVHFTDNGSSLEFEHGGGDQLFFDSPSLSVIMDINGTTYPLNDSALGTLSVGEKGALDLNNSEQLPAMELYPGDSVSVKVVDYESGVLVVKRELEVKEHMVIT